MTAVNLKIETTEEQVEIVNFTLGLVRDWILAHQNHPFNPTNLTLADAARIEVFRVSMLNSFLSKDPQP